MSVALENARLFDETQRRTREYRRARGSWTRHFSSTLDLATVMDRIAASRQGPARRRPQRHLPARCGRTDVSRDRRDRRHRASAPGPRRSRWASASSAALVQSGRAEYINDTRSGSARDPDRGHGRREGRASDGGAARRPAKPSRARWPSGARQASRSPTASSEFLVGLSLQATVAIENARLLRGVAAARGRTRHRQHGFAAARRQARRRRPARVRRRAGPPPVRRPTSPTWRCSSRAPTGSTSLTSMAISSDRARWA